MERSNYNYFFERSEGTVGYNARTGAFAFISANDAELLQSDGDLSELDAQDLLIEMGFLHFGNELELVTERFESERSTPGGVHLTLVPTLACNFHCDYCYQNEYRNVRSMSEEVKAATLRFIEKLVLSGRQSINIDWYGGEPLMQVDTVCELTSEINRVVTRLGGEVNRTNLISNGSLLTVELAKKLSDAGVNQAQISFDSIIYEEGTKRGVLMPDGSLSCMLLNAIAANDYFAVTLRINVSKDNQHELDRIIQVIKSSGFTGSYYCARVHNNEVDTNFLTASDGKRISRKDLQLPIIDKASAVTLTRKEFSELEWQQLLVGPNQIGRIARRLTPKNHFCSATTGKGFVIDPVGDISRCWHSAGASTEAIGNVLSFAEADSNSVFRKWISYTPMAYAACKSCKVLPLCMGGCSHPRMFMDAKSPPCESIKFQIKTCVEAIASRVSLSHANSESPEELTEVVN